MHRHPGEDRSRALKAPGIRDDVMGTGQTAPRHAAARTVKGAVTVTSVVVGRERRTDLAVLPLEQLRAYRGELQTEEDRVSYWRRLLHARLDVVRSDPARSLRGARQDAADPQRLREALSTGPVASRRRALVRLHPSDDLPPLPDLAVLWASMPSDDAGAREELAGRLLAAAEHLSEYRTTLHAWLDEATGELIERYRVDPTACLVALPTRPF